MTPRLRIAQINVQPVLVWDDGESLSPGPPCNPVPVAFADLPTLAEKLREQLAQLEQEQPATGI